MIRLPLVALCVLSWLPVAAAQAQLPTVADLESTGVTTTSIYLEWTAPPPATIIIIAPIPPDPTVGEGKLGGGGSETVLATAYELSWSTENPDTYGSLDTWYAAIGTQKLILVDPPQAPGSLEQRALDGLQSGMTYYVCVRSEYADYGWSDFSNVATAQTEEEEPPIVPQDPPPTSISSDPGSGGVDGPCSAKAGPGMSGILALLVLAVLKR